MSSQSRIRLYCGTKWLWHKPYIDMNSIWFKYGSSMDQVWIVYGCGTLKKEQKF